MKNKVAIVAALALLACLGWWLYRRRTTAIPVAATIPVATLDDPLVFTWGGWKRRSEVGPEIPGAIY